MTGTRRGAGGLAGGGGARTEGAGIVAGHPLGKKRRGVRVIACTQQYMFRRLH